MQAKQKEFRRISMDMQKECIRISEEIHKKMLPLCPKQKNDEQMACLMNFFWNYAAVPLHCSCSFYCIVFFLQNWFKPHQTAKTFITCLPFLLQPAPFFCTTLTSTESEFAKTGSRRFWPSCSSKTKPNPCKPFKVLYKYATNKCDYIYNMLL